MHFKKIYVLDKSLEMPKEIITSLISAFVALLPIIINYFGKKGKDTARKNLIDESQVRINFINNYYDSLHRLLPDAELEVLKKQLVTELYEIKSKVNEIHDKHTNTTSGAHSTFQKIFLTYRPLSFMGWVWAFLFYLDLFMLLISLLGAAINESGEFSGKQFADSIINEEGGITAVILLISFLLLFRWLAIRNDKRSKRASAYAVTS